MTPISFGYTTPQDNSAAWRALAVQNFHRLLAVNSRDAVGALLDIALTSGETCKTLAQIIGRLADQAERERDEAAARLHDDGLAMTEEGLP